MFRYVALCYYSNFFTILSYELGGPDLGLTRTLLTQLSVRLSEAWEKSWGQGGQARPGGPALGFLGGTSLHW